MISLSCVCSNVTVTLKQKQIVTPQIKWLNPMTGMGKLAFKYNSMTHSTQISKWSLVRCNCCGTDCALISDGEVIVNPIMKESETLRKNLTFSNSFNLYVDLQATKSKPQTAQSSYVGSLSLSAVRDPTEKELLGIKQKRVEQLFQEKERKIREFVMEQEELYESERRNVNLEFDAIKSRLESVSTEPPKITMTPNTLPKSKSGGDIFDMDEDFDIDEDTKETNPTNSAIQEHTSPQFARACPVDSKRATQHMSPIQSPYESPTGVFTSNAQHIKQSQHVKIKDDFPSTFKEYTISSLTRTETLPVSSSFIGAKYQF
ncbi:hypothetical protein EIN_252330 [Entamoeba invadens IP1]|uniref:Uncharacterized protein n=1 Tax=Entamoeba invadens IP1 TaxID=370355 RepID=A0A0A1UGN9_ENTIV|nr:hypothetical protein EIN_252330 [Entamoeba invadens IP1]ELP95019.1 hypothetical protein EIN_252330 [Entamoeba invadens IP1]|eukprot:XP_004261790.1 hypothetical protein EIN_252330 [Entamoeba invadens IP1]